MKYFLFLFYFSFVLCVSTSTDNSVAPYPAPTFKPKSKCFEIDSFSNSSECLGDKTFLYKYECGVCLPFDIPTISTITTLPDIHIYKACDSNSINAYNTSSCVYHYAMPLFIEECNPTSPTTSLSFSYTECNPSPSPNKKDDKYDNLVIITLAVFLPVFLVGFIIILWAVGIIQKGNSY